MRVWGIDRTQLAEVVMRTNGDYGDNIVIDNYREQGSRVVTLNFVLRTHVTNGPGSRRAGSGRRTTAVCWHAHRDVMATIFEQNPNARIKTAMADYRGEIDFYRKFPDTASHNVGSIMVPATMESRCECGGQRVETPREWRARFEDAIHEHNYNLRHVGHVSQTADGDAVDASSKDTQAAIDEWDAFMAEVKANKKDRVVGR